MAWSFIASSNAIGTNATVPIPTGYLAGDLLVAVGGSGSGGGFTSFGGGWTDIVNDKSSAPFTYAAWKIAGASEPAVTFTNPSTKSNVAITAYRNMSATPLDVIGVINHSTTASATSTNNAVTTTQANDLVLNIFTRYASGTTSNVSVAPVGNTTRVNLGEIANTQAGIFISDENIAAAGLTTARTLTTDVLTVDWAIQVAFNQATSSSAALASTISCGATVTASLASGSAVLASTLSCITTATANLSGSSAALASTSNCIAAATASLISGSAVLSSALSCIATATANLINGSAALASTSNCITTAVVYLNSGLAAALASTSNCIIIITAYLSGSSSALASASNCITTTTANLTSGSATLASASNCIVATTANLTSGSASLASVLNCVAITVAYLTGSSATLVSALSCVVMTTANLGSVGPLVLYLNVSESINTAESFAKGITKLINESWTTADGLTKTYTLQPVESINTVDAYVRKPNAVFSNMLITVGDLQQSAFDDLVDNGKVIGYDRFRNFIPGNYTYQTALFRVILESVNSYRTRIDSLSLTVDLPDINDAGTVTIPASAATTGVVVTFNRTFTIIPQITLTLKGGTVIGIPQISGTPTSTKFTAIIISPSTGAGIAGVLTWAAHGY